MELIREKDGIRVERLYLPEGRRVRKTFLNAAYAREIAMYRVLNGLGVPTLRVFAEGEDLLLMEDLGDPSCAYRLATKEDMDSPETARALAAWYRSLHTRGEAYAAEHPELYDEYELITEESLRAVRDRTGTGALPVWSVLTDRWGELRALLDAVPRTLVYNDYYYTNMAVRRDGTAALMFDYNLAGRGCVLSDIRNVLSQLTPRAADAFLEAYGAYPPCPAHDITEPLISLISGCRRETLPPWAEEALRRIGMPEYTHRLCELLEDR